MKRSGCGSSKRLSYKKKEISEYGSRSSTGVQLDQLTFFDFVQHCDIQKGCLVRKPQARPRILRLYPVYSSILGAEGYEDYFRVKLMLHHPFQYYHEIQSSFSSYEAALQDCDNRGCYHPRDPLDSLDDESDKDESEDESDEENEVPETDFQDPWIVLAARNALKNLNHFSEYDLNLGTRAQDRAYEWQKFSYIYDEYGEQKDFFDCAKLLKAHSLQKPNNPDTLQPAPRICFDSVMANYEQELLNDDSDQLLLCI